MVPTYVPNEKLSRFFFSAVVVAIVLLGTTTVPTAATASAPVGECSSAFDLEGPQLYLPANENARVTGALDGRPTNASVLLYVPTEGSTEVVRNDSPAIDGDRWTATLDLSAVEEGRTFAAWFQQDGDVIDAVKGEVGRPTANLTFQNGTTAPSDETVTVQQAHLDNGGFVTVRNNSPLGRVLGISNYLPPGTYDDVRIPLREPLTGPVTLVAVTNHDSNCNRAWDGLISSGDGPYTENGTGIADSATVRFPTPSPTPTSTPSPTPTPSPVQTSPPSASLSPTDSITGTESPGKPTTASGFGIGIALLAVVGGLLVLFRT